MHYAKSALAVLAVVGIVALVLGAAGPSAGVHVGSFFESAFAFDAAEGTFDRTLQVNGPVNLEVRTGSGSIDVRQGDSTSIVIHARVKARERDGRSAEDRLKDVIAHPPVEQNGNNVVIGHFDDRERGENVSISYEITAPAATHLVAHSGSGSQVIDGLQGPVEAKAGSGHLRINNIGGNVDAHTGSGGVEANNIAGSLRASAGSGSIRASNIGSAAAASSTTAANSANAASSGAANIDIDTGSGGIHLENVKGTLDARAGSGHISASGQMLGGWALRTGSGGVDVHLPNSAAFNLEAHTGSGSLSITPPITMQGTISRHDIRGAVRGGGPLLQVQTGSGGISVE